MVQHSTTRLLLVLAALLAVLLQAESRSLPAKVPAGPIKNFVVLMMENRAFDHMLGYMTTINKSINGLTGQETNPWDVSQPNGRQIKVSPDAKDETPSPDHSIPGTTLQIFGYNSTNPTTDPNMKGFVASARTYPGLGDRLAQSVMQSWSPKDVPIITSLAQNFLLFDAWHASVPGPTYVNRLFFHSATSNGSGENDIFQMLKGYPQKTLYQILDEAGYTWGGYCQEVSDPLLLQYPRYFPSRFKFLDQFAVDAKAGNLPTFSFLSPRFFALPNSPATDQHPAHSVAAGEALIKQVYEALRSSPSWEQSALLLTYDEHGGFYDHVAPPKRGIPNPDGSNSINPPFKFDRLGIRVPTILISPWVDAGIISDPTIDLPTSTSKFEHTSLISTLTRMWGLPGPLTKRDAWAAPFDYLFRSRATPRSNTPVTLPPVHQDSILAYRKLKALKPEHLQPLSDLHVELIQLGNAVAGLPVNANLDVLKTEEQAGLYLTKLMKRWMESGKDGVH